MNEDKTFNIRNMLVLLFEIILIVIAVGGLTFATSRMLGSSTIIKFGEYNVDYVGSTEITVSDLEPISDSLVNYDSSDGVVRVEFSLRGVEANEDEHQLIYDIMIDEMNIDCSLLNEYTKWNLYKNGELLYNGNFSPKFDGNVLTDNFRLTEIQQDLPRYNEEYDNYVLIIWISESCDDITSCDRVDQSGIVNSLMNMKVFVAILGGEKVEYKRVPSMNATCVNKPILYDGMIPVYYDKGEWRIANSTNSDLNKLWYDYDNARWANTVFVSSDKYKDSKAGTIINQEDILGYYVWIPRFKYKLWSNGEEISDSYNAYKTGVDIIFESGVHSTGTGKCLDNKCGGYINEYLTHPAFSDDLRGFWISKYEISEGNKFIPNVEALKNKNIDEYKNIIGGLSNIYGLIDEVDSHVVSNSEWGATVYLSHSKYGVCKDNKCEVIGNNKTNISENNKQDTTTGNVYGVYDMSGASSEYTVGNGTLGSALSEVRLSDNEAWDNSIYIEPVFVDNNSDFLLRGGVDMGLYSVSGLGMKDISTRAVIVNK